MFLSTRQPMSLSFSTVAYKKYCYLEDFKRRRFKTTIPHSAGRTCVGLTCGYLILYGTRAYDFWLVNLITRHELHFPRYLINDPAKLRGILVFSPSMSQWVFVISKEQSNTVSFCLAGKEVHWDHVTSDFPILDLHFFQGKTYTLNRGNRLYELRLNPTPTLTLLELRILNPGILHPEFASWGKKLYVMGYASGEVYGAIMEVDFDKMKWVCPMKRLENYVCFGNVSKAGGAGKVGLWVHPREQYERFGYFHGNGKVNNKNRCFDSGIWYYPHDCLSVNLLQE